VKSHLCILYCAIILSRGVVGIYPIEASDPTLLNPLHLILPTSLPGIILGVLIVAPFSEPSINTTFKDSVMFHLPS